MKSHVPAGAAGESCPAAPEATTPKRVPPAPEPRVLGAGFGAIGIAAVAAAVRYQSAPTGGPRPALARSRS